MVVMEMEMVSGWEVESLEELVTTLPSVERAERWLPTPLPLPGARTTLRRRSSTLAQGGEMPGDPSETGDWGPGCGR